MVEAKFYHLLLNSDSLWNQQRIAEAGAAKLRCCAAHRYAL